MRYGGCESPTKRNTRRWRHLGRQLRQSGAGVGVVAGGSALTGGQRSQARQARRTCRITPAV